MKIHPAVVWGSVAVVCLALNLPRWAFGGSTEMTVQAVLVWGTNGEKPPNKNLKELEPELARKLSKAPYKWKNYFEVDRRLITIPANTNKHVPMSEPCELEIKNLGDDRIEVKLIGRGKPVSRHVEPLPMGQTMILSGDDKDDNAWLIVLRQQAAKK
jgi:hypothetical protein